MWSVSFEDFKCMELQLYPCRWYLALNVKKKKLVRMQLVIKDLASDFITYMYSEWRDLIDGSMY